MRVFTYDQIEDGRIPRPGHFADVLNGFEIAFKKLDLLQQGTYESLPLRMLGAIVIGSMARKHDALCTSDIDIVVFYDDSRADASAVERFSQTYRGVYTEVMARSLRLNIPVNIYNVFSSRLISGETRHTRQFLKHAIVAMGGFDGTVVSSLLAGNTEDVRQMFETSPYLTEGVAKQYLCGKLENLRDGHFSWGGLLQDKTAHLIGNAFNAPFHGARQLLDVFDVPYVDTKRGVIDEMQKIHEGVANGLEELAFAGREYALACEAWRDKASARRPTIDFEGVYGTSSYVLSELIRTL